MSSCMYTAQGDFVCQENEDTKDTIENFRVVRRTPSTSTSSSNRRFIQAAPTRATPTPAPTPAPTRVPPETLNFFLNMYNRAQEAQEAQDRATPAPAPATPAPATPAPATPAPATPATSAPPSFVLGGYSDAPPPSFVPAYSGAPPPTATTLPATATATPAPATPAPATLAPYSPPPPPPPPISQIPPDGFFITSLPNGQYKNTCPDCVYNKKSYGMGNILECNCEKTNFVTGAKELINTKLNNCSGNNITNYGGRLLCG